MFTFNQFIKRGSKIMAKKTKLGDEVEDKVSGFKGVAIAFHDYLNGCRRISVQPQVDKDGKLPDSATFDEPQIKVITKEKAKAETGQNRTGGPEKYMPLARSGE